MSGAAKQLGLPESQLYTWRKKARYEASRSETGSASAHNARPLAGSRGGYYARRHQQANPCRRKMERERLDNLVARAFAARKGRSGAMGLTLDLDEMGGRKYSRKTVSASMKRQGLAAKAARKFKSTTGSDHGLPVAPNLLDQDFSAQALNQKWICDITTRRGSVINFVV